MEASIESRPRHPWENPVGMVCDECGVVVSFFDTRAFGTPFVKGQNGNFGVFCGECVEKMRAEAARRKVVAMARCHPVWIEEEKVPRCSGHDVPMVRSGTRNEKTLWRCTIRRREAQRRWRSKPETQQHERDYDALREATLHRIQWRTLWECRRNLEKALAARDEVY